MAEMPAQFTVKIGDMIRDVYGLSRPDAVSAFMMLWIEYHYRGTLPSDDESVREIADVSVKKWPSVRAELMKTSFADDWTNPIFDAEIFKARAKAERSSVAKRKQAA